MFHLESQKRTPPRQPAQFGGIAHLVDPQLKDLEWHSDHAAHKNQCSVDRKRGALTGGERRQKAVLTLQERQEGF